MLGSRMGWYVYILRCRDGTLYTGITVDLRRRLEAHRRGMGAKYTRTRLPVKLVYREPQPDRSGALKRENALRRLGRAGKVALIGKRRESGISEVPGPGQRPRSSYPCRHSP